MGAFEEYKVAEEAYSNARKRMLELVGPAFHEGADELFRTYPTLKSFGWQQYTPYFNDGDACVFSAHTDSPLVNACRYDILLDKAYPYDEYERDDESTEEEVDSMVIAVVNFLEKFPEEVLLEEFGDHAEIQVRPSSIEVFACCHD